MSDMPVQKPVRGRCEECGAHGDRGWKPGKELKAICFKCYLKVAP